MMHAKNVELYTNEYEGCKSAYKANGKWRLVVNGEWISYDT